MTKTITTIALACMTFAAICWGAFAPTEANAQQLSARGGASHADFGALMRRLEALETFVTTYRPIIEKITQAECAGQNNFAAGFSGAGAVQCKSVVFPAPPAPPTPVASSGGGGNSDYLAVVEDWHGAPETLDCGASGAAAGFYQDIGGRCGEPSGLAYWEDKIKTMGEAAAKEQFKKDYVTVCTDHFGGMANCNSTMLCAAGDTYDANTNRCISR